MIALNPVIRNGIKIKPLMHKCFKKKRIVMSKSLYNEEIRDLIQKRKMLKHQERPH